MRYLISKSRWLMVLVVVAGAGAGVALLGMPGQDEAPRTVAEAAEQSPELQAILDAVAAREAKAQSVRYEWVYDETMQMDSWPRQNAQTGEMVFQGGWQEHQRHRQTRFAVVIDGRNGGYAFRGPTLNMATGEFQDDRNQEVSVDGATRQLGADGEWLSVGGGISGLVTVTPAFDAHRLLEPYLTRVLRQELTLAERTEYRGHPCVVIERDRAYHYAPERSITRWWLAEDMDYCVLKIQGYTEGPDFSGRADGGGHQWHLRYVEDAEVGWRLTGWDMKVALSSGTVRVTDCQFNQPVDIHNPGL